MLNTFLLITLAFGLTLAGLIDVARKDFGSATRKTIWWIVASIPVIGTFTYLVLGFRKGKVIR